MRPSSLQTTPLWRSLCWLALLLLALGLPRVLVVCTGSDGIAHLEFEHPEGRCGEAGLAELRAVPGDAPATAVAPSGCEHRELDIAEAPLPRGDQPAPPPLLPCAALATAGDGAAATAPARRHAPATGPPRPPGRTLLLRSTHLLI